MFLVEIGGALSGDSAKPKDVFRKHAYLVALLFFAFSS